MHRERRGLWAIAFVATACTADPSTRVLGITNGAVDTADPAVAAILRESPICGEQAMVECTGTLIAPRAVLTAAHCVDSASVVGLAVYFGADTHVAGEIIRVQRAFVHPNFDQLSNDIAVLGLEQPANATPVPLFTQTLDASFVGQSVRVAGFGDDGQGNVGLKRQGMAKITAVQPQVFVIGPNPAMSCAGDSGGPVFLQMGTTESVAGVTAFGDPQCMISGTNTRVDVYAASFVQPALAMIAAMPPGNNKPAIDPAADYCSMPCTTDDTCPQDMQCEEVSPGGAKRCGFRGLSPGRFGAPCQPTTNTSSPMCAQATPTSCLTYLPCTTPGDGGCSCSAARGPASSPIVFVLFFVIATAGRFRWAFSTACPRRRNTTTRRPFRRNCNCP